MRIGRKDKWSLGCKNWPLGEAKSTKHLDEIKAVAEASAVDFVDVEAKSVKVDAGRRDKSDMA